MSKTIKIGEEKWWLTPDGNIEGRMLFVLAISVKTGIAQSFKQDMLAVFQFPKLKQLVANKSVRAAVNVLIISQLFFENFLEYWGETPEERRATAEKVLVFARSKGIF